MNTTNETTNRTMIVTTTRLNNLILPRPDTATQPKVPSTNGTTQDVRRRSPSPVVETATSFPVMVHRMLTYVDESDDRTLRRIVSWNRDGRTFYVHDQTRFERTVLPKFFANQTRYRSFQRQLNFYDFQRVTKGMFEGSYGHPLCVRGQDCWVIGLFPGFLGNYRDQKTTTKIPDNIV
jgi:hypothetical protein